MPRYSRAQKVGTPFLTLKELLALAIAASSVHCPSGINELNVLSATCYQYRYFSGEIISLRGFRGGFACL